MEVAKEVRKSVYKFGNGTADGHSGMKNLLGGKGANLAEMCRLGIPVPPGFTITTQVCTTYNDVGKDTTILMIEEDVREAVATLENIMGSRYGDPDNPR